MKSKIELATAVLVIVAVSGCSAVKTETAQLRLRISAPKLDCADVPVHTTIELPEEFTQVPIEQISVVLKEKGKLGFGVPGQIALDNSGRTQLWWILPKAKANSVSSWIATLSHRKKTGKKVFSWKGKPGDYLDLLFSGRKVTRYMYARDTSTSQRTFETSKPFHHVFDAQGEKLLTNSDPNALYPHHRGLFIGWQKVESGGKGYDFWGMTKGDAAQVHQKFLDRTAGPVLAKSKSLIHWNVKNGQTLIAEERQTTVFRQPDPTILLMEFRTQLKAVNGDVLLHTNNPAKAVEHGGFQYRPHNDVAKDSKRSATYTDKLAEDVKVKYLFHKDGIDPKKDMNLPWVAMSYGLNGRHYSIQHMNPPDNPRPTYYSAYRDYGRFGAYFEKKIKAGQTLTLCYYIWVIEGKMPSREELAGKYRAFVDTPRVKVLNRK